MVLLLLGYEVFHHRLGNGCGSLGLGWGFVPLCRLGSLGLFDGTSRHHLGSSGGKTAGSGSDLYNCTDINGLIQQSRLTTVQIKIRFCQIM